MTSVARISLDASSLSGTDNTTIASWNGYSTAVTGASPLPLLKKDETFPYVRLGTNDTTSTYGNYIDVGTQSWFGKESPRFTSDTSVASDYKSYGWDTDNGWIITASSIYTLNPFSAFDKTSSEWLSTNAGVSEASPAWLCIKFPTPVVINSYSITSRDFSSTNIRFPSIWRVQGSNIGGNNDKDWIDLEMERVALTWTVQEQFFTDNINISNTPYMYYRLRITKTLLNNSGGNSNAVSIVNWSLFTKPEGFTAIGMIRFWKAQNNQRWFDFGKDSGTANILYSKVGATNVQSSLSVRSSTTDALTQIIDGTEPIGTDWYLVVARVTNASRIETWSNMTDYRLPKYTTGTITNYKQRWLTNNWIGRSNWTADNYSCLDIREMAIYDYALSDTSLLTLIMNIRQKYMVAQIYSQLADNAISISWNGNIGIGVTNPASAFVVSGDMEIQGSLNTSNSFTIQTGPYTTNKNAFLSWVQSVSSDAAANWWSKATTPMFSTVSTGSLTGYNGGILLPDGRVVFVPYTSSTSNNIGIFNPSTNTFSTIAAGSGYVGGVLLPDGRVLFVPFNASTNIGFFDPSTNTFSATIPTTGVTVAGKYWGGVLLPDGRVLFVPNNASNIGLFDPSTNVFSTGAAATGYGYGCALLADGRVVFVPFGEGNIGIFNPYTNEFSATIPATGVAGTEYRGAVLLPDGRVLFVPTAAADIGIFNPSTNGFQTIATGTTSTRRYWGGALLSDGRALLVSYDETNIGIFDPVTNTFSNAAAGGGSTTAKYRTGVLLPDGRMVCIPYTATNIGIVSGFAPVPIERCLHPCFNKF